MSPREHLLLEPINLRHKPHLVRHGVNQTMSQQRTMHNWRRFRSRCEQSVGAVVWVVALVVVLGLADRGFAQSSSTATNEQVEALNDAGVDAFSHGEYASAAKLFERAYGLDQRPELLKNRAVALYRAGEPKEALAVAEKFLATDPPPSERSQAEQLVDACRIALGEEALAASKLARAEAYLSQVRRRAGSEMLSARLAGLYASLITRRGLLDDGMLSAHVSARKLSKRSTNIATITPLNELEDDEHLLSHSTTRWVLLGAGATMLGSAAIYHGIMETSVEPEFRRVARQGGDQARYHELDGRLRTANWLVPALYGIGGLAVGTGLWFSVDTSWLDPTASSSASSEDAHWTLSIGGRF